MHPIIYDVAVSLDGYISGPSGDISKFAHDGPVVDDYAARLGGYKTAIMGRKTYEFGYDYGLEPGQNPYPNMNTIVFSQTLECPERSDIQVVKSASKSDVLSLKKTADGPIYLCGGGAFAGWLLGEGLIDRLVLKRAPCVLGGGVSLFGGGSAAAPFSKVTAKTYENGYVLEEYDL
ncbi:dihydrofolate reductase family protein [Jannaschia sp. CCS1]|uniref:dihydrofolate reductase family protein n=1 Tax=Jannaschia sp. (strain CCS1) TaxID=290400 RepID=UPI000053CE75|nr:dihydrofolate reductase family protein [Jannaschia sp. CCS1]ABD54966.1 bifunctional deaminase-reductase-like protein [Jannaschia sp. CCS1]